MAPITSRLPMRLPRGFAALRPDLGATLRARRRADRLKQQVVAEEVGIARETLSRIERGRALPRPDTLDRLMIQLELDWDDVALRGEASRRTRVFHDTSRGEACYRLGRAIRAGRELMGISLRDAGGRCGLSASQLSRIERGEVPASRALAEVEGYENLKADERSVAAAHPFLATLASAGFDAGRV